MVLPVNFWEPKSWLLSMGYYGGWYLPNTPSNSPVTYATNTCVHVCVYTQCCKTLPTHTLLRLDPSSFHNVIRPFLLTHFSGLIHCPPYVVRPFLLTYSSGLIHYSPHNVIRPFLLTHFSGLIHCPPYVVRPFLLTYSSGLIHCSPHNVVRPFLLAHSWDLIHCSLFYKAIHRLVQSHAQTPASLSNIHVSLFTSYWLQSKDIHDSRQHLFVPITSLVPTPEEEEEGKGPGFSCSRMRLIAVEFHHLRIYFRTLVMPILILSVTLSINLL